MWQEVSWGIGGGIMKNKILIGVLVIGIVMMSGCMDLMKEETTLSRNDIEIKQLGWETVGVNGGRIDDVIIECNTEETLQVNYGFDGDTKKDFVHLGDNRLFPKKHLFSLRELKEDHVFRICWSTKRSSGGGGLAEPICKEKILSPPQIKLEVTHIPEFTFSPDISWQVDVEDNFIIVKNVGDVDVEFRIEDDPAVIESTGTGISDRVYHDPLGVIVIEPNTRFSLSPGESEQIKIEAQVYEKVREHKSLYLGTHYKKIIFFIGKEENQLYEKEVLVLIHIVE